LPPLKAATAAHSIPCGSRGARAACRSFSRRFSPSNRALPEKCRSEDVGPRARVPPGENLRRNEQVRGDRRLRDTRRGRRTEAGRRISARCGRSRFRPPGPDDAAGANAVADTPLVAVLRGGVDVTVAGLDRGDEGGGDLGIAERPGAETDQRDVRPVLRGRNAVIAPAPTPVRSRGPGCRNGAPSR
jgi:hypothetical protein